MIIIPQPKELPSKIRLRLDTILATPPNHPQQLQRTRENDRNRPMHHFVNSVYNQNELTDLKLKAINKMGNTVNNTEETESLVLPLHYFKQLKEFNGLKDEINQLIGNTRVMFAVKKHSSIGNSMVRNKNLCILENNINSQKCGAPGRLQCPPSTQRTKQQSTRRRCWSHAHWIANRRTWFIRGPTICARKPIPVEQHSLSTTEPAVIAAVLEKRTRGERVHCQRTREIRTKTTFRWTRSKFP